MASTLRFDNWENSNGDLIGTAADGHLGVPGTVLQVVSTTKTDVFSVSGTGNTEYPITGLSAAITPKSTDSKILIFVQVSAGMTNNSQGQTYYVKRDSAAIGISDAGQANQPRVSSGTQGDGDVQGADALATAHINYLDNPSSTSELTYSVILMMNAGGTSTAYVNRTKNDGNYIYNARGVSTITLMEIAG